MPNRRNLSSVSATMAKWVRRADRKEPLSSPQRFRRRFASASDECDSFLADSPISILFTRETMPSNDLPRVDHQQFDSDKVSSWTR